jgi:putative flippase GtrA
MPWALANAVITVVSTLLATELHARFTFGGGHATWRQHAQSAGSAAIAYAVTSAAMLVLQQLLAAPGAVLEQLVYLSASALAGVARFTVLRLVVFARIRSQAAPTVHPAHPVRATAAHTAAPADPRCSAAPPDRLLLSGLRSAHPIPTSTALLTRLLRNGPPRARHSLIDPDNKQTPGRLTWGFLMERVTRIELALSAWEADVLPLNYTRA